MKKKFFQYIRLTVLSCTLFCLTINDRIDARSLLHPETSHAFPTMYMGTIEFPRAKTVPTKNIEPIAIYYMGKCVKSSSHEGNPPSITFDIPRDTDIRQTHLYLVITEKPERVGKKMSCDIGINNTTDYWKVPSNSTGALFELTLIKTDDHQDSETDPMTKKPVSAEPIYEWIWEKKELPGNTRIPDEAIVIAYKAELVDDLRGGDQIQLPTIIIKQTINESFEDLHLRLQMESLDTRAFHAPDKQVMLHHKEREATVLILPIT